MTDTPAAAGTPLTDTFEAEQRLRTGPTRFLDTLDFARTLERELSAAHRQNGEIALAMGRQYDELRERTDSELSACRAELAEWNARELQEQADMADVRAKLKESERLLAEATKDA